MNLLQARLVVVVVVGLVMRIEAFDDFGRCCCCCCCEGTDPEESSDLGIALGCSVGSELGGGEGAAERSLVLLVPFVDSLGADGGDE